ncbi:MAG TPA: hypothetical protein VK254_04950 [Candidatus Bathyarchaeia archaeon]|nr:hypothetical protein [Candidatus Bathyarchaeia archaeon]
MSDMLGNHKEWWESLRPINCIGPKCEIFNVGLGLCGAEKIVYCDSVAPIELCDCETDCCGCGHKRKSKSKS